MGILLILFAVVIALAILSTVRRPNLDDILKQVGVEDTDACFRWAFGDGYGIMPISKSHHAWNKRHSDLFILCGCDSIEGSIRRIGRAYLSNFNN